MSRLNVLDPIGAGGHTSEEANLTENLTWETWSETPYGRALTPKQDPEVSLSE